MQGDEGAAAALLYERADSIGIRGTKVSIGEKITVKDRNETAVTVRGTGSYLTIGRFCEAVENLPAPVRIRQVTASKSLAEPIDVVIDFVVLSQLPTKGK